MTPRELTAHWRSKASVFREHEQTSVAIAYELCAKHLDEALNSIAEAPLTLAEAAELSGYSIDHLGRLVRLGNCGIELCLATESVGRVVVGLRSIRICQLGAAIFADCLVVVTLGKTIVASVVVVCNSRCTCAD